MHESFLYPFHEISGIPTSTASSHILSRQISFLKPVAIRINAHLKGQAKDGVRKPKSDL
jgi:hypothetical protein